MALRLGGRTLGGALSWATPQPLAPFTDDSPFAGLPAAAEVVVNRQVLADPAALGAEVKVWARLKDGTPLVTAARRGDGQVVFFHVTANSEWSNLPLSGLFVEMLRRITSLGRLGGGDAAQLTGDRESDAPRRPRCWPLQVLDGFGLLRTPPPTTQAIAATKLADAKPNADNPPGYYGPAGTPRALSLITAKSLLKPLPSLPLGVDRRVYEGDAAQPLEAQLLLPRSRFCSPTSSAVLLLRGLALGAGRRLARGSSAIIVLALLAAGTTVMSPPAAAQGAPTRATAADARAIGATGKVSFGYVLTGDGATDEASRQGLIGLNKFLIAHGGGAGRSFCHQHQSDEITFYPLLYWPVLANARALNEATLAKIDAYMKQGGMIIFDTKDYGQGMPTGFNLRGEAGTPLQRLLGNLDIPRLESVPEHHVLTKSFYLLRSFPGRWEAGPCGWRPSPRAIAIRAGRPVGSTA